VPVREDYRTRRRLLLRRLVDPASSEGLEVGAFDLPVVVPDGRDAGPRCWFADMRSTEELASEFGVALEALAPIEWVVQRARPLAAQIPRRFDYVILCHVLEHVPEPIGFLADARDLLRPGGVLFLAVPDKRATLDATRPSTTIDHLLARHHHGAPGPPLAQIMEFARTWDENWRRLAAESPRAFFDRAVAHFESGAADAHCNVWQDDELFAQLDYLTRGGFLPGLEICLREPWGGELNEFYVALRALPRDSR
jgi:SAM-dependent methyltransferase